MKRRQNLILLVATAFLWLQVGCASLLGQIGGDANIKGKVIMPDGTPAKDVVMWVEYERIVRGDWGVTEETFYDEVRPKDGRFHLRYSNVTSVSFIADSFGKPGYRSFHHEFEDDLKVSDLVVHLRYAGEYRDILQLVDVRCRLELKPELNGGGIIIGQPKRGSTEQVQPIEASDLFVERVVRKTPDGKGTEQLVFKGREGVGFHVVKSPNPKYIPVLISDMTLPPEGPYDTKEIVLPNQGKPTHISAFFHTPDGKYGALQIVRWEAEEQDGKLTWRVQFNYLFNPDGARTLNHFKPIELDEQGRVKVKEP